MDESEVVSHHRSDQSQQQIRTQHFHKVDDHAHFSNGAHFVGDEGDVLGTLKPGEVFGEISFLEGVAASASVVADLTPNSPVVELYVMDAPTLKNLLTLKPGLLTIIIIEY